MRAFVVRLRHDQSGATAIEYALLASMVAVTAILGVNALGGSIDTLWGYLETNLVPAMGG